MCGVPGPPPRVPSVVRAACDEFKCTQKQEARPVPRQQISRRAFLLGAGLVAGTGLAALPAPAHAEGGALTGLLRLFARLLGRSAGPGAGGAAAAAVAASDPRPCGDLAKRIDKDLRDLRRREREIERRARGLTRLEIEHAGKGPGAAPSQALLDARSKQKNRTGWFRKDLAAHRGDVASFNARCVLGEEAMETRHSYVPTYLTRG